MRVQYFLFLACAAVAAARATTGAEVIKDLQNLSDQAKVVAEDIQNVQGGDIGAELVRSQLYVTPL